MSDEGTKARVLVIVRWPVGGIRTYLKYVYHQSVFSKYDFVFVVAEGSETKVLRDNLTLPNIEVLFTEPTTQHLLQAVGKLLIREKFDFIHAHGLTAGLVGLIPAQLMRVQVLLTLHDVFVDNQFSGFRGRLKLGTLALAMRCMSLIQPVSNSARDNLFEYLPSLKKRSGDSVIPILNGVDINRFTNSAPRDLRSQLDLPVDAVIVGFMGRFMSQKGFIHIINAVKSIVDNNMVDRPIVVLSVGSGGYIRETKADISSKQLDQNFEFLPFVENVGDFLKSIDFLVMPSLWEACGLLAMEALIVGCPLIASSCMQEVLDGSPASSVKPGSSAELAEAIVEFAKDNRREEFEKYASIAAGRFDVAGTAEELEKLYLQLTQNR